MEEARIFGLRAGSLEEPRTAYLERGLDVKDSEVDLPEGVAPTEVFRFAARCEEGGCSHFNGKRCTLAARLRETLPPVAKTLPPCSIRDTCRWYAEEGEAICFRCPQVVTLNVGSQDEALRTAATPPVSS